MYHHITQPYAMLSARFTVTTLTPDLSAASNVGPMVPITRKPQGEFAPAARDHGAGAATLRHHTFRWPGRAQRARPLRATWPPRE